MTTRKASDIRCAAAAMFLIPWLAPVSAATAQERAAQPVLSGAEIEALYRARQDSARMRFVGADVEFVTGMISHHAQALVMSALAATNGAGDRVQVLAARITNGQQDEIGTMQRWLHDRGLPVPHVKIEGTSLVIEGGAHDGHEGHVMPGMLSAEQMRELADAWGPDFDRLFLTYMIQHHSGAVTMVDDLIATDGAAQEGAVFKLASDIRVDQITEIERMKRMLAAYTTTGESR